MYKIGIISDTHNVLRDEVINELKTCDLFFHAGDFVKKEVFQQFNECGKMIAVKGNNDDIDLPQDILITIYGYRFYMTHQRIEPKNCDFYIFGHSHQYMEEKINNIHYLNPGSCGRKRFSLPLTYMILYIDENGYDIERKDLDRKV